VSNLGLGVAAQLGRAVEEAAARPVSDQPQGPHIKISSLWRTFDRVSTANSILAPPKTFITLDREVNVYRHIYTPPRRHQFGQYALPLDLDLPYRFGHYETPTK
jgi:hypothetical protein